MGAGPGRFSARSARCDSLSLKGIVFPKKLQKLLTKFPGLATSGRHDYRSPEIHFQMIPLRDV